MITTGIRAGAVFFVAVGLAGPLAGQEAEADPTAPIFKRVAPPQAGTTRRITVQLTELPKRPSEIAAPEPAAAPVAATRDGTPYDWYWQAVSPRLGDLGPLRVRAALDMLGQAPTETPVPSPRLQALQTIVETHGTEILSATVGTRVSPALVLAMIAVESSGRTQAVSSAGAAGLMQLMPATAERFGVSDRMDPRENIRGGVAYMDWLLQTFSGDVVLALAGYNAGENAVKSHDGVPPYAETRGYVPKVLAGWTVARALCMTPPEFVTDPCVLLGRQAARAQ